MTDAAVHAVIADVAGQLNAEVVELTAELEGIFLDRIPELDGDDAIRDLLVASTGSNLSAMFEALRHGIAADQIDAPAPAVAYAQRFAQRGLPVDALLRAYRLGDHRFIQWFLERLAAQVRSPDELERAASAVVEFVVSYVDRISEALIDIHGQERDLWARRTDAARAAQIRAVLSDASLNEATAEIMSGWAMHPWHTGAVLWGEPEEHDPERRREEAARSLHAAGASAPLIALADAHTLWVWFSSSTEPAAGEPDLSAVLDRCPTVRVAIGEPARGLAGFRRTHTEARRAQAVAEAAVPAMRSTHFSEVRLAALLSENLDELRGWVHRTLGGLAVDDAATAKLRETVRTHLETGGTSVETGRRLHVHRNTVYYRVQRAEEVRGRSLDEDRVDLEVALALCAQLGRSVLLPSADG